MTTPGRTTTDLDMAAVCRFLDTHEVSALEVQPTRTLVPFVGLELATICSGIGNGISMVAFPWLVLQLTGSATAAGLVAAITAVPLLLSFLFAGVAVDIFGRRPMAVGSDLMSMVSVALVPILSSIFGLGIGLIAFLAVLGAVFDPAGISARESMIPEAAAAGRLRLERVNGIHEAIWGSAYLIGPGVGGLAIGFVGAAGTFWISACLFAIGALTMTLIRVPGSARPPVHERPDGVLRSTREGISFVWNDRVLRSVAILSMIVVGFWLPVEGVVFPVYYQAMDNPEKLGITVMALAGGGIIGALIYSAIGHRFRRRPAFVLALLITGIAVVGMALLPPFPVLLLFGLIAGFAYGPVGPLVNISMQERTPTELRGRVVGLITSAAYVTGPVGYLVAGPLIQSIGLEPAFMVMAVGVLVVGVLAVFMPSLRGMDETQARTG